MDAFAPTGGEDILKKNYFKLRHEILEIAKRTL